MYNYKRWNWCQLHGFTLVELLVVISIIALLLAVLLPSLQRAREFGRTAVCLSNERQVGLGIFMYVSDNGNKLPPLSVAGSTAQNSLWYGLILPYMSQKLSESRRTTAGFYMCPSAEHKKSMASNYGTQDVEFVDYGVNYAYGGWNSGLFQILDPLTPAFKYGSPKLDQILHRAMVFALMDVTKGYNYGGVPYNAYCVYAPYTPSALNGTLFKFDKPCNNTKHGGINDSANSIIRTSDPPIYHNYADFRHNDGVNVLFMDGHCAHVKPKEWIQKEHWLWR